VAAPEALKEPEIADVRRVKTGLIHFVNIFGSLSSGQLSMYSSFNFDKQNVYKTCLAQEMVVLVVSVPAGYVALQL
jgi:hypothetical protein